MSSFSMHTPWQFLGTLCLITNLLFAAVGQGDGPQDNLPDRVRSVPSPGVEVSPADRAELEKGLESDVILRRIVDQLPIHWTGDKVTVGEQSFDAEHHAPVLIYPNPLNRQRYVVLTSGFTFREYDYLNNARQVPRLPNWGIVDLRVKPDSRYPGKIVSAGFFGEQWQVTP